jgi:hypothetical protein
VMTFIGNRQRTVQGLFQALGESRHSRPFWPPPNFTFHDGPADRLVS